MVKIKYMKKTNKKKLTKKYKGYTDEAIKYLASLDKDAFTIDDTFVYHEYSNIAYTTGSYEDTPYDDLDDIYCP
jgi:hypothetical protein